MYCKRNVIQCMYPHIPGQHVGIMYQYPGSSDPGAKNVLMERPFYIRDSTGFSMHLITIVL